MGNVAETCRNQIAEIEFESKTFNTFILILFFVIKLSGHLLDKLFFIH